MQKLRLFSLIATIIGSTGSSVSPVMSFAIYHSEDDKEFIYSEDLLLPRTPYEEYTFSGYIYYRGKETLENTTIHARFYNKYYFGDDDWYSSSYAFRPKEISPHTRINYSFSIPNVITISNSDVRVDIGLYNVSSRSYYIDNTLHIGCKQYGEYNTKDYQVNDLVFNNIYNQVGKRIKETYKLKSLRPFINVDNYYYLDISSLVLSYDGINDISASSITLSFEDINNLYPNINKDEYGNCLLTLSLKKEDDYSFAFDSLYVNPDTLDMSSNYVEGYRKTKYLFLPRNKVEEFDNYNFVLCINDLGPNEIDIVHEFTADFSSLLIGPCYKSKYCIVGGRI